jgi:hypothetical protein
MTYWDQALLSNDLEFQQRLGAAAAVEVDVPAGQSPLGWAADHQWQIAASPGFADAYASALAADVPNPGRDPAVISDQMILSAIQALIAGGGATA